MITKEDLALISEYSDRSGKKKKSSDMSDVCTILKSYIKTTISCDDKGNMCIECNVDDLCQSEITVEEVYRLCSDGWEIKGDKFCLNLD